MNEQELKVFIEIICQYFTKTTQSAPSLEKPVIEFSSLRLLDYTGFLHFSGPNQGWVYISMSSEMLGEVLRSMGEFATDEELLRDSVGEIASIITSNAREHFGAQLQISVPTSIGPSENPPLNQQTPRFVLPFSWRNHQAKVGIALES